MTETLRTEDGRSVLRMQRRLSHPPEKVWRAVTEPAHLARWFPSEVEIDLAVGGKVRFLLPDGQAPSTDGVVTDLDPPHLIAYTWGEDHLRWQLRPDGGGTVLVLTQTFADHAGAASFAAGWDTCIEALARVVAGEPVDPPAGLDGKHEEYVRRLGLDVSSTEDTPDGPRLRIERQLTRPAETVWPLLRAEAGDGTPPVDDSPPTMLEYEPAGGGRVRWELGEGTGHGARLVVTATGAAAADAQAWKDRVETIAARLPSIPAP